MKAHGISILALPVLACLVLPACGGEPAPAPAPAATPKKPAAAAKAPAQAQAQDDSVPALFVPEGYRYDARGRRDPFVNPVPRPVAPAPLVPAIRPPGLPGVLLAEAKTAGIVFSRDPGMAKVFLQTPKGTFLASRGDALFDAVIKEIREGEVVFTMVSPTTRQPTNRETIVRAGGTSASAGENK